jgi:Holliday junction resolvase-like predicted endonuclease
MANTEFLTPDKLLKRANAPNPLYQYVLMLLGVLSTLACFWLFGITTALAVASLAVLCLYLLPANPTTQAKYRAGAAGEAQALSILKQLPNRFTVFNQINLPNRHSSTGANEADLIVCGSNVIFIIEVKHNHGSIVCDERAAHWHITKTGRKGTEYTTQMRNPVRQVQQLTRLLGAYLKENGTPPWIQGVVLFTHAKASFNTFTQASVPILQPHQLIGYIESFHAHTAKNTLNHDAVINTIAQLRQP